MREQQSDICLLAGVIVGAGGVRPASDLKGRRRPEQFVRLSGSLRASTVLFFGSYSTNATVRRLVSRWVGPSCAVPIKSGQNKAIGLKLRKVNADVQKYRVNHGGVLDRG